MSGLLGFAHLGLGSEEACALLTHMADAITYSPGDQLDVWSQSHHGVNLGRVHHGPIGVAPQPLFNETGSLCILMDGEVFGEGALRAKLVRRGHRIRFPESDSEFCLHLFEEMGDEAFRELNGSFSIVIYDLDSQTITLVADRLSSRPIFVYQSGPGLAFASQMRPLWHVPGFPRRLDLQAVFEFFTFQRLLGEKTYSPDVRLVPPGSIGRFQDGRYSIATYWNMRFSPEHRKESFFIEALVDALMAAVERRTKGDSRLGLLLSGGLDSRGVLAADVQHKIQTTLTISDFDNRATRAARATSARMGRTHIEIPRTLSYYSDIAGESVALSDGMSRFDRAHFLGFGQQMAEHVDVILHGIHAGCLFKGEHIPKRSLRILGRRAFLPIPEITKMDALADSVATSCVKSLRCVHPETLFKQDIRRHYVGSLAASVEQALGNPTAWADSPADVWNCFSYRTISRSIHDLSVQSLRPHLVERLVFIDNDLFELHLRMPFELRYPGRTYQEALRRILPAELHSIPDPNTGLPAFSPYWAKWLLSTLQSAGRQTPLRISSPSRAHVQGSWQYMKELLRHSSSVSELVYSTISDPQCISPSLFDRQAIRELVDRHMQRRANFSDLIYVLVTFGRWYSQYAPERIEIP